MPRSLRPRVLASTALRSLLAPSLLALPVAAASAQTAPAPPPPVVYAPASDTLATPAPAPRASRVALVVEGAVEIGGDDAFTVFFTDGTDQTLRAGQGGTLAVGVEAQPLAAAPVWVRGTVGYKFVLTAADNANIRLSRIPLEALVSYRHASGVHAGVGGVAHVGTKLHGDGFLDDESFDPAAGVTLEVGYKAVALTATSIRYRSEGGDRLDGSSIGLSFVATRRF